MMRRVLDLLPIVRSAKRADGSDAADGDLIAYHGADKALVALDSAAITGGGGGAGTAGDASITLLAPKPGDPFTVASVPSAVQDVSPALHFQRNTELVNYARLQAYVSAGLIAGATLRLQYSLDNIVWTDAGAVLGVRRTGQVFGAWTALAAGAKAGVFYRLATSGGDGARPLSIGLTMVDFSGSATAPPSPSADAVIPYTTNLKAWYRSDKNVTVDGSVNASNVGDSSGNALHLFNEDATKYPAYVANALGSIPALRFPASPTTVRLHSLQNCPLTAAFTAIAVFRPSDLTGTNKRLFTIGDGGKGICINGAGGNVAGRVSGLFPSVAWLDTTSSLVLGDAVVVTMIRTAGVTTIYRNGIALSPTFSSTPNNIGTNQAVFLGYANTNNTAICDWFESAYFIEPLTGSAFDDVHGYLLDRYGL